MKKSILILTVGAMGLTVVNAQQRTTPPQMPTTQEQMEITHQLTDGIKLGDLPDAIKSSLDDVIEDGDTQIVNIDRADGDDAYEITFRKDERLWRQEFDKDGRSEGGERPVDTQMRGGQQGNMGQGGQTGQTQTGQRQGTQTQTGGQAGQTQTGQRQGTQTQTGGQAGQTQTGQRQGTQTQTGGQAGQTQTGQRQGTQAGQQHISALENARRMETGNMPRNLRNTIDQNPEDRDAEIRSIERGTRDGQENYDVTFNRDDRTWTRTYDADGREVETDQDNGQQGGNNMGTYNRGGVDQTRTQGGQTGGQAGQTQTRQGTQTQTGGQAGQTQTGGQAGQTQTGGQAGQTQTGGQAGQTQTGQRQGTQTQTGGQAGQTGGQAGQTQTRQGTQTQTGGQAGQTQTGQTQAGERTPMEGATRIQNRDLPQNIRNTIDGNREDRDAEITSIDRGTRDGQENYDVTFRHNDRTWTRSYGGDGREIDTRRRDDNR